jgi:uncharacterized damage-inducible protein DinB
MPTDTATTPQVLTFRELLGYTDEETRRWEAWFRGQPPAVLHAPMGEGRWPTVGELAFHVFVVERRYAERLLGEEVTPYEGLPHATLDELFGVYRTAREKLERWIAAAPAEEYAEVMTFQTITAGTLTASKRKIVAHALLHGIRHWAQIATALRQAGHPGPGGHDILMTTVFG